jgi:hypothetical protein
VRQIVGRNAWTGVGDLHLDMPCRVQISVRLEARPQGDPAVWAHRLEGIHTQIEEDLLQLFRITHDWRQHLGQFERDLNVHGSAAIAHGLPDAAHNIMQVDGAQVRLRPACRGQELGNEATDPVNLCDDHLKKRPIFLGEVLTSQELLSPALDDVQGGPNFMRQT